MEYKTYLIKDEKEKDVLKFVFNEGEKFEIDLNSEDQDSIQKLFYKIIELAFSDDVSFSLNSDNHEKDLFYEVAFDYIEKLNEEIKLIKRQIPEDIK